MNFVALRQVPYRPTGSERLLWGFILSQREGLSLLFIQRQNEKSSNYLVIAEENVVERVFTDLKYAVRFPIEDNDVGEIGTKMSALGEGMETAAFKKMFETKDDDEWK